MELASREIAILIWSGVLGAFTMAHAGLRSSFFDVVRAAVARPLPLVFGIMVAWTAAAVTILSGVGLWTPALLKDTVVWFFFAGAVAGGRALAGHSPPDYSAAVRDALTVAFVVEFVVNLYTFPLPVEVAMLPLLMLLGGSIGWAEFKKEQELKKRLETVAVFTGFIFLVFVAMRAWTSRDVLLAADSLRAFLLPLLLSTSFLPMVFSLHLLSKYEWLLNKLRGRRPFRLAGSLFLILRLGPRPARVQAFGRRYVWLLPNVQTISGLRSMLDEWAGEETPIPREARPEDI